MNCGTQCLKQNILSIWHSLRKQAYSTIENVTSKKKKKKKKKKTGNFQIKKTLIFFHFFCSKHRFGHSLERPRRGDSNVNQQSMFLSRNKKYPSSTLYKHVFVMPHEVYSRLILCRISTTNHQPNKKASDETHTPPQTPPPPPLRSESPISANIISVCAIYIMMTYIHTDSDVPDQHPRTSFSLQYPQI